jgi:heptosyltransferase-3
MPLLNRPKSYDGEDLGPKPHIAIIFGQEQIGDFVLATPLMRGLRDRYPNLQMDYLGGEGTRQIEQASSLVDARYSLFGPDEGLENLPAFIEQRVAEAGPYDLIINLDAAPLAAQAAALTGARYVAGKVIDENGSGVLPPPEGIDRLWRDTWNRADLLADYPEMETQFLSEIFCRLARVKADYARYEVPIADPERPIPDVLMATGGSRPAKLWTDQNWLRIAEWLRDQRVTAGLLGANPNSGKNYYTNGLDADLIARGVEDLRAPTFTLPQVAGALKEARLFLTIDNGLMHLAAAVGTRTIALFGASARRIWVPPVPNVTVLDPSDPCTLCEENRFQNPDCLLPVHQCMQSISPERVIAALKGALL